MSPSKSVKPSFILLFLLVSFGSVGAVLFTPALPLMQKYFDITIAEAQLTITLYLVGYALGQLPYGPLANAFGRKKTLLIGLFIAMIGSLLCAFSYSAHSFGLLLFGRLIQALGGCVGIKISFTMIGDVYEQAAATKKISKLLIAFAVMPGIAMTIGGWITQFFGWQSCFYFLALFSIFMLGSSCMLPETSKELCKTHLKFKNIISGYGDKFKNSRLVLSAIIMGCGTAIVYIFAAKAPFIGIDTVGLTPNQFGSLNLITSVGMIAGSFLASSLVGKLPFFRMLLIGIVGSMIASLTMLVPFLMGQITWITLFMPVGLIYAVEAIVYANVSSYGLSKARNKSNGSAMLNFINLSMALASVLFAEWVYPESVILMPISFVVLLFFMLFAWMKLKATDR